MHFPHEFIAGKIIPAYVYMSARCGILQDASRATIGADTLVAIALARIAPLLPYFLRRFTYNAGSDFNRQSLLHRHFLTHMTRFLSLLNVF